MTGLTLKGIADNGAHLVVLAPDGSEFELPITDALRRAVRHAAAASSSSAAPATQESPRASSLGPREIQQRIRSGLSPAELAELTGESRGAIDTFAAPVLAERAYIVELARTTRIGREPGAPLLGDLVSDRLAARGVASDGIEWDAWRSADEPWHVSADYRIGGKSVRAVWSFDHSARSLTAEDEESRWLTETQLLDAPIPRRHLSAVRPEGAHAGRDAGANRTDRVVSDGRAPSAALAQDDPHADSANPTEALLEQLEDRRGTREPVDLDQDDDDEEFEGFGPAARARSREGEFTARTGDAGGDSGSTSPGESASQATRPTPAATERKAAKRGRASVPSWDEIVFGAKNE